MGVLDAVPAPGPVKAAPAAPSPNARADPEGRSALVTKAKEEEEHSDEEGDLEEEEDEPPAKRPRTEENTIDLMINGQKQQLRQRRGSEGAGNSVRVNHCEPLQRCDMCMVARPPAPGVIAHTSPSWLCVCGRRGDLPFDHEINREIMSTRPGRSALESASSTSAASSSSTAPNPDSSLSKA
jgi:hypothetical protein